jgi:hypothetical protein
MKVKQVGKGGACCVVLLVLLLAPVFGCAERDNLPKSRDSDMNGLTVFSGGNDQGEDDQGKKGKDKDIPVLEVPVVEPAPEPPKPGTFEGLDAETEMRIKRDFMYKIDENSHGRWMSNYTIDDVFLERYYGAYNGWEVVKLDAYGITRPAVTYPTFMDFVWKQNGGIYELYDEAYRSGVLTADDVRSIVDVIYRLQPEIVAYFFGNKPWYGGKP